jgi:hypothetical protein
MKLPVWQSTVEAFDYCWRERGAAVRFGLVPFIVVLALSFTLHALGFDASKGMKGQPSGSQIAFAVTAILEAIVYLPMTVTWYRIVVLGDGQTGQRPAFTLGRLEGRLLWWQIIIVIIMTIALAAVGALAGFAFVAIGYVSGNKALAAVAGAVVGLPPTVAILIAVTRMAMALVLVAAEKPVSLRIAWNLTRGLATRLFLAVVLIMLTGTAIMQGFKLIALLVGMIAAMIFNSTVTAIVPYLTLVGEDIVGLIVFLGIATLFGQLYLKLQQLPKTSDAVPLMPVDEY